MSLHQHVMTALLDDAAVLEDDDDIGVADWWRAGAR